MRNTIACTTAAMLAQLPGALSSATSSARCCAALSSNPALEDKVYFPNTTQYDDRLESYWSVSAALSPSCMVLPETAEDASVIIQSIAENSCQFGIRGGAHGSFALSNSVDVGVTIDFGYMNSTTYNEETKIASVQPGGHWQSVYETLDPYGVTVTGARAGTVGVGGFVTGGGNSFHSASHGFACDMVQNFEVVLANGTVVDANAGEHADLWRALKGGSGNFGLVTRIDMYAIDFPDPAVPNIFGGELTFDVDNGTDGVIDAFVAFADNISSDQNSSSIAIWSSSPAAGGLALNVALDNTLNDANPPAFDGYLAAPGITSNTLRSAPMAEITEELGSNQPYGFRNIWFVGAYDNDPRVLRFAVDKHAETVARATALVSADSGLNTLCLFQPLPPALVAHGAEKGGNALGLEARVAGQRAGVLFLAALAVRGADDEAAARPLVREWIDAVDAYAGALGANWAWRYLNYAHGDQDPIASFGAESVGALRAVSAKYDPDQVFQTLRRSGFKIPK